jgi:hypothetical protein
VKRVTAAALVGVVYAWWATGVSPFTTLAYVLIAIPSVLVVLTYVSLGALSPRQGSVTHYYRERARGITLRHVAPWLVVLLMAIALEVLGLALGGRSRNVPTLSTTMDHLLIWHWGRCVLYLVWLFVGATPVVQLWQHRRSKAR